MCNHFPNNQELTTKAGLARNLLKLNECGTNSESWFPRCYDFTDASQIQEFLIDFQRTSAISYMKKQAEYFKKLHRNELKRVKKELRTKGNKALKKYKGFYLPLQHKVNISMLKAGIAFIQYLLQFRTGLIKEDTKWTKYTRINKHLLDTLAKLGQSNDIKECGSERCVIPSLYFEFKVVSVVKEYSKVYPQARMDGAENIWIVKPCFISRGIGVHCINDVKEEYYVGQKMQAKVIQKYIENTFLLHLPGPSGRLECRKFDIRQWVLVTSFNPLVIYMFNSCYLKICGSEFSLIDFKDKYRHLANYSIQKSNTRVNNTRSDLVMSIKDFIKHLNDQFNIKVNWQTDIFSKLAEIVKNTIYSGLDAIEHKSNSFELYGFDFVLDNKLNPWLIEVNLSPACSERTDWLTDMLGNYLAL